MWGGVCGKDKAREEPTMQKRQTQDTRRKTRQETRIRHKTIPDKKQDTIIDKTRREMARHDKTRREKR